MTNVNLKSGFSLIELLVVVAIIAVLAAIGTVGYGNYVTQTKIKANAANLDSISTSLNTEWATISNLGSSGTDIFKGVTVTNCEDMAKATVRYLNRNPNFKNPYFPNGVTSQSIASGSVACVDSGTSGTPATAAYGNYMTIGTSPNVAMGSYPFCQGTIIISCGDPTLAPASKDFLIYQCTCDQAAGCQFDSGTGEVTGSTCVIPTPSGTTVNPYTLP